jgi:hypothetical protein
MDAQAYNFRMKGLAAASLAVAIALPACAQHGGGHGGFGGHSAPAPAFHGSFAPSSPFHYNGGAIARGPASYPSSMRLLSPGVRYPATAPTNRPGFYHPGRGTTTHNFYIHTYPVYPYAYPSYVYGYLPADLLDDSFNNNEASQQPQPEPQPDYNDQQPMPQPDGSYAQPMPQPEAYQQSGPQPQYGYAYPQPPYPGYPQPQPAPESAYVYPGVPPGYAPQPAPAAPQMQYVPGSAATVILIYKDGRPPEQIQNYLATRSTLTVLDGGRRREIPLSDLNIPATVSANRQTGVDFQLPTARP